MWAARAAKQNDDTEPFIDDPPKGKKLDDHLSEEIKKFRQKKEEFEITNDRETYVVLTFSSNSDKAEFLRFLHLKNETYIDGYEFARKVQAEPSKPGVNLRRPLT